MKLLIRIDWDEGVMQMNLVEDEGAAFDVPADWPGEYFPSYLPEGLEVTWKSYIPDYMHRVHFRIGRTSDQFQRNGREFYTS